MADAGQKNIEKINELLEDIRRNGALKGKGKPERLKYRPGYSRRIDEKKKAKETAALISQKPPCMNERIKILLLYDGFFSFAVVRQINSFSIY